PEAHYRPVPAVHIEAQPLGLIIQIFHNTGSLTLHMRRAVVMVFPEHVEDGRAGGVACILLTRKFDIWNIAFHTTPLTTQRTLCVSNDRAGHEQQNECVSVKVFHWNAPEKQLPFAANDRGSQCAAKAHGLDSG